MLVSFGNFAGEVLDVINVVSCTVGVKHYTVEAGHRITEAEQHTAGVEHHTVEAEDRTTEVVHRIVEAELRAVGAGLHTVKAERYTVIAKQWVNLLEPIHMESYSRTASVTLDSKHHPNMVLPSDPCPLQQLSPSQTTASSLWVLAQLD